MPPSPTQHPGYLTLQQVAQAPKGSPQHVRDLVETEELPGIDIGHGGRHTWRVSIVTLLSWEANRSNQPRAGRR